MSINSSAGRVLIGAFAVAFVVYLTGFVGSVIADRYETSVASRQFAAQLVTREIAPGDDVAIRVSAYGAFSKIRARVDDGALVDVWRFSNSTTVHEVLLSLPVPADARLGPLKIFIEVALDVRIPVERKLNTVYYRVAPRDDAVEIAVPVRSPAECAKQRWVSRALGIAAWLAAFAMFYVLARWSLRRFSARWRRKKGATEDAPAIMLCLVLAVALAIPGPAVFGRALLHTAERDLPVVLYGLQTIWLGAIVLGMWRGFAARAAAPLPRLWYPAALRAVVGSPREAGYREAASRLPPMLSREAPRCESARLVELLRGLGCDVRAERGGLDVAIDGEPVLRIRGKGPEPWLPEDLSLTVPDGIDATPLVLELSTAYGPLEYKPHAGVAIIIER